MRILCRNCQRIRDNPKLRLDHDNPDPQKYYCFANSDLTQEEIKREYMTGTDYG